MDSICMHHYCNHWRAARGAGAAGQARPSLFNPPQLEQEHKEHPLPQPVDVRLRSCPGHLKYAAFLKTSTQSGQREDYVN